MYIKSIWAAARQNQQSDCAPSEDSDQPGHPPSLICLLYALGSYGPEVSSCGQRRLIGLRRCPGRSESSLGAHVILLVLLCGGSFFSDFSETVIPKPAFLARLYEVQGELLWSPVSAFLSHCNKVLYASLSKVHISTATHQKAFIFGP